MTRSKIFKLLILVLSTWMTIGQLYAAPKLSKTQTHNTNLVSLHYLLTPPDGGDEWWVLLNHDDSGWQPVANLEDLSDQLTRMGATEAWIRLIVNHTPETLNNCYFKIAHSGLIEIFANGIKRAGAERALSTARDYIIGPRRPENLGLNVYAIHFKHDIGPVQLEIHLLQSPWLSTDVKPATPAPVLDIMSRDAQVCRGHDGAYYLTATTGDDDFLKPGPKSWLISPGIQVFRSTNLRDWQSLGYVWTFDRDGTWHKEFGHFFGRGPARGIFAPQIHFLKGKYWIVYSVNHSTETHNFGISLMSAQLPEGPYTDIAPSAPLTEGFDADLFEDDDGSVYLLKHGGQIARMNATMDGLAEPFRQLQASNYPYVGYEGVFLFKQGGKYYLSAAEWNVHADGKTSYDSMIASSEQIYGPYGDRYCAIRFGGHNGYFQTENGDWYATVWCYPDSSPWWQKVSIVRMKLGPDGLFRPLKMLEN